MSPHLLRRAFRLIGVASLLTGATLVLASSSASAHNTVGSPGANFRAEIRGVAPAVADLTVKITDLGQHVEVTSTLHTVIVLGYDGEPYLRIDDRGVSENVFSPSSFLNRTSTPAHLAPDEFDATAEPSWNRRTETRVASWHDHRIHPMASGSSLDHLGHAMSFVWRLELLVDGQPVTVNGTTRLLTAPSLLPSILVTLGAAGLTLALLRRFPRIAATTLGIGTIGVAVAISFARWHASTATTESQAVGGIGPLIATTLLAIAIFKTVRRGPRAAAPFLLFAFGATTITVGFALAEWLFYAELPATGPAMLWRLLVATVIGVGSGGVLISAMWLRSKPTN